MSSPQRDEYDPGQPSLLGPKLRLERAEAHLDGLEAEGRAYVARNPLRVSQQLHREGEWWVVRIEKIIEWPDPRWGVIASEVVHHLRSALDNLLCQLVVLNGETPTETNQFPIYSEKVPSCKRLGEMLGGVRPKHRAFIQEIQPYKGTDTYKWVSIALDWIAWLSNRDKHRFLHATFGVREKGAQIGPVLSDVAGIGPIEVIATHGTLYEGAELVRFRDTESPDAKMYVQGKTPLNIAFGEPRITIHVLREFRGRVAEIVEHFAPDFP